ncbi:MAG: DUF547 domain-containing protein [Oceanococcaceae bacterium]
MRAVSARPTQRWAKCWPWLLWIVIGWPAQAIAAPKAELWPLWEAHDAASTKGIDHSAWAQFLDTYLRSDEEPHRLRYADVSPEDRSKLQQYLAGLQALPIASYNRAEQMAYWINLYNAATVDLVLEHWPVPSITKIRPHFLAFGPWNMPLLQVADQSLSLNDIEHRILRPIWADPRIHYALNCASIGCPSLARAPYQARMLEAQLDAAARRFVNSARGVRIRDDGLVVSSIYHWFAEDFGGDDAAVIAHLRSYAQPALADALAGIDNIDSHSYDWAINAAAPASKP